MKVEMIGILDWLKSTQNIYRLALIGTFFGFIVCVLSIMAISVIGSVYGQCVMSPNETLWALIVTIIASVIWGAIIFRSSLEVSVGDTIRAKTNFDELKK